MKLRILRFLPLFVLGLGSAPAFAEALPAATGEPVLTVTGNITQRNSDWAAVLDLEMLQSLTEISYTTSTIWTEGVNTFTGVPLAEVLALVGADGQEIRASAINDYSVIIPLDSVTADVPMVAYALDGEAMPRREKGPLWIVYPYDAGPEYQTGVIYNRSIWQLDRLDIIE